MPKPIRCGLVAGLLLALAACAVPRPSVQGLDNASAEMAIKSRMLRAQFDFSGVDVTVVEGIALLTGHVPDEGAKAEAGRIAWSAPNVRDVGNELVVNPEGRSLLGAHDQLLLSQVRARLIANSDVRADRIHLEVYDGVVYLLGEVRSASEADEAAREASVVPGVKRVVSFIGETTPAVGASRSAEPYDPFEAEGREAIPQGRTSGGYTPPNDEAIEESLLGAPEE